MNFDQTQSAVAAPRNLFQYLVYLGKQMAAGFLRRLPLMIAMGAVVWILHTYWLVFVNDGFSKPPSSFFLKHLILLTGSKAQAAIAWALLGMVVSTLVCRCYRKGIATAVRELVGWPEASRRALANGGPRVFNILLVACAVALAISGWLSNALAALQFAFLLSLGLLDRDASPFFTGVRFGWNDLDRTLLKGKAGVPSAAAASAVILLGAAAGFLLGGFLPRMFLYIACVVALIGAFVVKFGGPAAPAPGGVCRLPLLLVLVVAPTLCWGHDGGWSESGKTFAGWYHNQGFWPAILLGFWPAVLSSFFGTLPWVVPLSDPPYIPATIYGTGTSSNPYSDTQGAPETQGPETQGPETQGPETKGPETKGSETKGSETKGPETKGPESQGPETKGHETQGPESPPPPPDTQPQTPGGPGQPTGTPGAPGGAEGTFLGATQSPWFDLVKNLASPASTVAGSLSEFFTFSDSSKVLDAVRGAAQAWKNNPTKEAAEDYIKSIRQTSNMQLQNVAGKLDTLSKVVDVVDAVGTGLTKANDRGFTGEDKALTVAAEVGKKGLTWVLTKNPVVGLVDSAVGGVTQMVYGKDGRIDIGGLVDKGADTWDKTTQEHLKNTQGGVEADATIQTEGQFLDAIRRTKDRIAQGKMTKEQGSAFLHKLRDKMFGGQP